MLHQSQVQLNLYKCLLDRVSVLKHYSLIILCFAMKNLFLISRFLETLILLTVTYTTAETKQISKVDRASISSFLHCFQIAPFIFASKVCWFYLSMYLSFWKITTPQIHNNWFNDITECSNLDWRQRFKNPHPEHLRVIYFRAMYCWSHIHVKNSKAVFSSNIFEILYFNAFL